MALFTHPNVTPNSYDFLYFAENSKISLQIFNNRVHVNKQCALFFDIICTQISLFICQQMSFDSSRAFVKTTA